MDPIDFYIAKVIKPMYGIEDEDDFPNLDAPNRELVLYESEVASWDREWDRRNHGI